MNFGWFLNFLGRVLIAALFFAGAIQKFHNPDAAAGLLSAWSLPEFLVWPALVLNLIGAIGLILGWQLFAVALTLAAYCAVTSIFHFIPNDPWQMSIFVKNWAITGGLLILVAQALQAAKQ